MKLIPWVVFLVLLAGCNGEKKKSDEAVREGYISQDSMTLILTDVQVAEAAVAYLKNEGREKDATDSAVTYYNRIFAKYKIRRARFEKSLKYYQSDPDQFFRMEEKVMENLSRKQSENSVSKE